MAKNIRASAKRKKKPLTVLADLAGVSRAHMFAFLKGKKDVTLGWLEKVAIALDVEVVDFVKEKGR